MKLRVRRLWRRAQGRVPLAILPVILAVCLALLLAMGSGHVDVHAQGGVWDLRSFDFSRQNARLLGSVAFIPDALLTPEQLEARHAEIQIGAPGGFACATSRITLLLPEGDYLLTGSSKEYAERLFVNGRWALDVGVPGDSRAAMTPDTKDISLACRPEAGKLVIVQQVSNFVHRSGGDHAGFVIGRPGMVRESQGMVFTGIIMGCFLALFLVHLALFFQLRSYRVNLWFSLFCLTWFFRSGVTGHRPFVALLPWLPWEIRFRMEYLALPITAALTTLMLFELFPGVLPRWFKRFVCGCSALFGAVFLAADTLTMSWALLGCYGYIAASILFVLAMLIAKFRRPSAEQTVYLIGLLLLFYGGLRDMFFFNGVLLFPMVRANLSDQAMLAFVFFQMTAMFLGTARETELAQAVEQRLTAENAALDRLSRMRGELLSTVSHETRTPLAVLSGYAELISLEMRKRGVDEATASDLRRISEEAQRLASLMERAQALHGGLSAETKRDWVSVGDIARQTARLYEPILARRGTRLTLDVPQGLPKVFARADELTQVLFNLLTNARNHTPGGEVALALRTEPGCLLLTLRDSGEGISPELLPRVFERGSTNSPGGSGLGLYLCRQIIESHGGEIAIESQPGAGTLVRIRIPTGEEHAHG